MDKLDFTNIEKENIMNFLKREIIQMHIGWTTTTIGISLMSACGIVWFSTKRLIVGAIYILFSCGLILSKIHFVKKIENTKQNLSKYLGIYWGLGGINLSLLSYFMLRSRMDKGSFVVLVLLIFANIVSVVYYRKLYISKIQSNYYKEDPPRLTVGTGMLMVGILLLKPLQEVVDPFILIGISLGVCAVTWMMPNMIYMGIKSYCYSLVDEKEVAKVNALNSRRNPPTFNRYGKK